MAMLTNNSTISTTISSVSIFILLSSLSAYLCRHWYLCDLHGKIKKIRGNRDGNSSLVFGRASRLGRIYCFGEIERDPYRTERKAGRHQENLERKVSS
jgi:hypothetical protein